MLVNLHVKNLALIDESDIEFAPGLNILTGETGAGKSLIIGSVALAIGGKASRSLLREGTDYALVELTFHTEDPEVISSLKTSGITPEDGDILLTRKIRSSGRSVCRINGETCSVALLKEAASHLIDIHGQHEHESLLVWKNHIRYLDAFAKKQLAGKKQELEESFRSYTGLKKEYQKFSLDESERSRQISFLQFEADEIEAASLQEGEDEELEREYRRLVHGQRIAEALEECHTCCSEGSPSVSDLLGKSLQELSRAAGYDSQVEEFQERLQEIDSLMSDFNMDLSSYMEDMDFSEETFQVIENRLNEINRLKSRYGKTIPDILNALEEKREEIEKLQNYETLQKEAGEKMQAEYKNLRRLSSEISEIRKEASREFTAAVTESLKDLNFLDVRFDTQFTEKEEPSADGMDEVRFLISVNPGEPLKALDQIASGGELSRIMLALKTVLAANDEIDSLIFDEIDTGISGRTAQKVAEKMKLTARHHQIICITHLPQIAAMADAHYLIEKTSADSHTVSEVRQLSEEESVTELARMLGGAKITETVLQNAREMKELAENIKR